MKRFFTAALALALVTAVEAKQDEAKDKDKDKDKAKQEEEAKKGAKEARDKKRDAVQAILAAKDKNHDGSLSREEYISGEADPEAAGKTFDEFNKNKDRSLSKSEIAESLGL